MKISKPTIAAAILAAATLAVPTFAQNDPPGVAARVAYLHGIVSVEVQGNDEWGAVPLNYPDDQRRSHLHGIRWTRCPPNWLHRSPRLGQLRRHPHKPE